VDGGSNGAIYGSNKSKMATAAILEKFQMAISPQRLTIYLYSTKFWPGRRSDDVSRDVTYAGRPIGLYVYNVSHL